MITSAGIIIWRRRKSDPNQIEFFLCTPGGPQWKNRYLWNFPKGQMEDGEDPLQCALREFQEETGTEIRTDELSRITYHGKIKQRVGKNVHVYSKPWFGEKLDEECFSNTFLWTDGKEYPEIGQYKWMTLDEIKKEGGVKVYYKIFEDIIRSESRKSEL